MPSPFWWPTEEELDTEQELPTEDESREAAKPVGCRVLPCLITVLLVFVMLAMTAAGCFCPEGSTWTADCYNFKGEWVGSASDDGCNCDCNSVMCGARVVNCNVYSPQPPQIYPRPSQGE